MDYLLCVGHGIKTPRAFLTEPLKHVFIILAPRLQKVLKCSFVIGACGPCHRDPSPEMNREVVCDKRTSRKYVHALDYQQHVTFSSISLWLPTQSSLSRTQMTPKKPAHQAKQGYYIISLLLESNLVRILIESLKDVGGMYVEGFEVWALVI